ncbi:MAG: hypothetical protein DME19_09810 [Verrucomicrobia bacterium]|nr:MAG: hypothetical protein DME19_09810 [Verrucomicrobiota bacterium]
MNWLNTFAVLLIAFLAVFLESYCRGLRNLFGTQIDLLPALIVYASLSAGLSTVGLLALLGGLWFDSLSANPLGISVLPLFVVGFIIHYCRELILREQLMQAQEAWRENAQLRQALGWQQRGRRGLHSAAVLPVRPAQPRL